MFSILKTLGLLSVIGSAVTLLLLALKPITKRLLGGTWQYYIWLVALLVFLLPVTLPTALSPFTPVATIEPLPVHEAQDVTLPVSTTTPAIGQVRPTGPSLSNPFPTVPFFFSLWLSGVFVILVKNCWAYWCFTHQLHISSIHLNCPLPILHNRPIAVKCTSLTHTPLLAGLFHPTLFLPEGELSQQSLHYMLQHELIHDRRRDIVIKWLALTVNALHWFNPFAYLLSKQINEDCEISCDIAVTKHFSPQEKSAYMFTILSLIHPNRKPLPLTTAMACGKTQLKRRFTMIIAAKKQNKLRTCFSLFLATCLCCTALFSSGLLSYAATQAPTDAFTVYNGDIAIPLANKPFIMDGEIFLPLRETLSALNPACEILWDNGTIQLNFPAETLTDKSSFGYSYQFTTQIGSDSLYGIQSDRAITLRNAPMIDKGLTYVSVDFFEDLMGFGQIPDFNGSLAFSPNPKDYYTDGEEVFIGTGIQQDTYNPLDENGNRRLIKRIVVDETGSVIAVVPIEYQQWDKWESKAKKVSYGAGPYEFLFNPISTGWNVKGETYQLTDAQLVKNDANGDIVIAYIPPANKLYTPGKKLHFGKD